jgi:hypothetical protein
MAEPIEDKSNKPYKNIKVSPRTHLEIARESVDIGKTMYELVDEAWECWKAAAAGTTTSGGSTETTLLEKESKPSTITEPRPEIEAEVRAKAIKLEKSAIDFAGEIRRLYEGKAVTGSVPRRTTPRHRKGSRD